MKRAHDVIELLDNGGVPAADIPPIVLVVDDHHDTLELYDRLFSEHGYWVACAVSGLQALEFAHDIQPDIIVTDVGLPGDMDGIDLIRELRADEKLCKVPVLVVTGRDPRDLPSFAGLVICGLLLKPIAPTTLVSIIENILQRAPRPPLKEQALPPA